MYTDKEYAETAMRANERGKILAVVDGALILQDPPPPEPLEAILAGIRALEAQQTPRMLRGAALGNPDDTARLTEIEAQIAALRAQMQAEAPQPDAETTAPPAADEEFPAE